MLAIAHEAGWVRRDAPLQRIVAYDSDADKHQQAEDLLARLDAETTDSQ